MFTIGEYVTRKSYNNDIVFEVIEIEGKEATLKGVDVRLVADAPIKDLVLYKERNKKDDFFPLLDLTNNLDRNEFFYLPGKILHVDAVFFDNWPLPNHSQTLINKGIERFNKINKKSPSSTSSFPTEENPKIEQDKNK